MIHLEPKGCRAETKVKEETMTQVSHQQAAQLLHNKFVVVLGDSIQRSVYKDLVVLLQKEKFLSTKQLRTKGEMSFEQDCLIEGGCLERMHNGTAYREVRQYQSDHHLVRFYFITTIYSSYMRTIIEDFHSGLKPDVVIVNSCLWDISRYDPNWAKGYKDNLHQFFSELNETLPEDTLVMWNLTMPLGEKIKGGFLVPEIQHRAHEIRYDVVEANFYSGTLANAYGMDVLDLHFQFRFSLHHRTGDGVHWNAIAHRRITTRVLLHAAQAWGVQMLSPPMSEKHAIDEKPAKPGNDLNPDDADGRLDFSSDSIPHNGYMNFEKPLTHFQPPHKYTPATDDYHYVPPHRRPPHHGHNPYVMKRRARRQYSPYAHRRPSHYNGHGH